MFIRIQSRNAHVCAALTVFACAGALVTPCSARGEAAPSGVSPAVKADDIASRLNALTPKFPAPPTSVLSDGDDASLPLELLGVDLAQNGAAVSTEAVALNAQVPLKVTAYWVPKVPVRRPVDIEIRLTSANPLITRSQRVTAGPGDKPEWSAGNVYQSEYAVDLERSAQVFSGKCFLAIGISLRGGAKPQFYPLQSVPVTVNPRVTRSAVAPDALQAAFAGRLRNLDVDFVLGKDALQKLALDSEAQAKLKAVGVVSAFGYGGLSQGAGVCDVLFTGVNGKTATATILCGVETARADYDSYPERANHTKIQVVESSESEDFNAEGRPFRRHKYACTIPIPKDIGPVASMEFRSLTDRIFEVYDVALLYGEAPE